MDLRPAPLVLSLSVGLLLVSPAPTPRPELAFAPEDGLTVEKRFTTQVSFELVDLSAYMGGEEAPEMIDLGDATETEMLLALAVEDEYVAVADGRPTELVRTFQTFSLETPEGVEDLFEDAEDARLRFAWDEDEEAYSVEAVRGAEDWDELDALPEDLDLRALLPEAGARPGERWELPLDSLGAVFLPGLPLSRLGDLIDVEEFPVALEEELMELVRDGALECFYQEEADGLATVELRVQGDGALDLTDAMAELFGQDGSELEIYTAELVLELGGEGTLEWDTEAGHFRSLELETELVGELVFEALLAFPDFDFEADIEVEAEFLVASEHEAAAE